MSSVTTTKCPGFYESKDGQVKELEERRLNTAVIQMTGGEEIVVRCSGIVRGWCASTFNKLDEASLKEHTKDPDAKLKRCIFVDERTRGHSYISVNAQESLKDTAKRDKEIGEKRS